MPMLKTLREFELEERVRCLERELAKLLFKVGPRLCVADVPAPIGAAWDQMDSDHYRVALLERNYEPGLQRYSTFLECRNPRPDQRRGEPVKVWRSAYYIDLRVGMDDEGLAHVAAGMHTNMLAQLHRGFLGHAAAA